MIFLGNMARGDFGISFTQQNRKVNDIIRDHFPVGPARVLAIGIAAAGGIVWGAITALYRNRLPDVVIMSLVILCISVPSFVFAALGQLALVNVNQWFEYPFCRWRAGAPSLICSCPHWCSVLAPWRY